MDDTPHVPSIRAIQLAVCERYGVTLLDLLSDRRSQTCTRPRMVAMWLAKRLTLNSIPKIGAAFRRDHSTVLHAIKRIDARRGEPETAGHLAALLLNLGDSGERGDMRRPRLRVVA